MEFDKEKLLCRECMNKDSCIDYEDSKNSLLKDCSGFLRKPKVIWKIKLLIIFELRNL